MHTMSLSSELRANLPIWAVWVLMPLPAATFWNVGPGRDFAYLYLFLGCCLAVGESFRRTGLSTIADRSTADAQRVWRVKMQALLSAAVGAVCLLTVFGWSVSGGMNPLVPLFAMLAVIPGLACVPYLMLRTGSPYSALVFVGFLMGLVKITGCIVVRIVYGPDALARGLMTLPWENPNLLVWFCLTGAMLFSTVFYVLGRREFICPHVASGTPKNAIGISPA